MNKITINNQEFEEINASIPLTEWVWYQNKWYKPVEQFKVGDWVYCNNSKSIFKYTIYVNDLKRLRKATSQEILEHLRTIAKVKGLVKGAKVKGIQSNSELLLHTIVQEDDNYYPETDEYAKSGIILYSNGKWAEKVEEVKDYEILNFYKENNPKNIYRICEDGNLLYVCNEYSHLTTNSSGTHWKNAINVGYKIHSVKCLKTNQVYMIGDICNPKTVPNNYHPITCFDIINNELRIKAEGYWHIGINDIEHYKPKFTFGGHEVSFKKIPAASDSRYNNTVTEVTCKGETGTHWQIEEILKNYFRPCKFGNVEVKSFTRFHYENATKFYCEPESKDLENIDKITIGCLTGTYKELYDIYQHCLTLLK